MSNQINIPNPGDTIYIDTSLYLSRGRDDIQGGKATINEVFISETLPLDHINAIFISLVGFPERKKWNYKMLIKQQEELMEKFGNDLAHPDPDYSPLSNPANGWG